MLNSNYTPSLADIAAVTNGNETFGGNNGWWILIILFALFGGWGNGGFQTGNGGGAFNNYVLSSDFASLQRQIDTTTSDIKSGITALGNGVSSLGYDQLQQMNGINNNIANLGYQLQQCCCENKQAIAQLRYDEATNTCAITNAINQATQSIMQNDNANYRQLHDENITLQIANKDDKIAALTAQINALQLAASQQAQNAYLISQLKHDYNACGCGC